MSETLVVMANAEYPNNSHRKLALVIGNSDYAMERSLFNTTNDRRFKSSLICYSWL